MSDESDSNPLDFSALDLMPTWAQDTGDKKTDYSKKYKEPRDDGKRRGGKFQRDGRGNRGFRGRGGSRGGNSRGRDDRRDGGGFRRGGGRDQRGRGNFRGRGGRQDRREEPLPKGITATLVPAPDTVDALEKHIRESNRTYPLIDLAKMVLASRERYQVKFSVEKDSGKKLYQCKSDGSVWLSRDEAVSHFLRSDRLSDYYDVEEVDVGAPSGNFSVVAVCGMSGEILGPPNHHEYQGKVARLHAERFSHMPLDRFKSRIEMSSEEETIEKWKDQVSKTLHYRTKATDTSPSTSETEPSAEEESTTAENAAAPEEPQAEEQTVVENETVESDNEAENAEDSSPEEAAETEEESVEANDTDSEEEVTTEEATSEEETANEEEPSEQAEEEEAVEATQAEPEAVENDSPPITSPADLAAHFRENYSGEEILEANSVFASGNIPGKSLSQGLLSLLKKTSSDLRRGFPLPMIQSICSALEKKRMRFFKRGKKALHVGHVRPKALDDSVVLTDSIQKIVDLVSTEQRCDVAGLLEALVPGFEKPKSKEDAGKVELSDEAKAVLTDLRWLTSEGYVLEFPDTRLVLGKQKQPTKKKAAKPAPEKSDPPKEASKEESKETKPEPAAKKESEPAEVEPPKKEAEEKPPEPAEEKVEKKAAEEEE